MKVTYWPVGQMTDTLLALSINEIASHLLADWIPTLPATVASSFIGWPHYLLTTYSSGTEDLISLRPECGSAERQWKSVLSWMLGVAGARHVLAKEGYQWIAPASAFYPSAVQVVSTPTWHPRFPRSVLSITRPSGTHTQLMPDYVAIRRSAGGKLEWAAVEAKATKRALASMHSCQSDWIDQAHNIAVQIGTRPRTLDRNIVVATRVNPNASTSRGRCVQVRAWNSTIQTTNPENCTGIAEVVSAHLFGLFVNLGLFENARGVAEGVSGRRIYEERQRPAQPASVARSMESAAEERERLMPSSKTGVEGARTRQFQTERGTFLVEFAPMLLRLADDLITSRTSQDADAIAAIATNHLQHLELENLPGTPGTVSMGGLRIICPD